MNNILRLGTIDYDEVAQTRRMLALSAVSAAAVNRTDDDLDALREVIEREQQLPVEDRGLSDLDIAFHAAVAEASGNRVLSAFVSALHRVTHPASDVRLSPDTVRRTARQHVAILDAISRQDPVRARTQMERHLDYVESLGRLPDGHRAVMALQRCSQELLA